jgi:hypothetical protein
MLPLEVVGPGSSLSMALIAVPYGRDASWRGSWQTATVTEGGGAWHGGDGGEENSRNFRSIQLRPDDCGTRPSAGEQLAAEAAERTGFVGDGL